jgi:N-sulfoglucosamine sulfohydrolase
MYYPMRTIRTRTHQLIVNLASALPFPIADDIDRSTTWRGIVYHEDPRLGDRSLESYLHRPRVELYDVIADPDERVNLAGDPKHESLRRGLEDRLLEWRQSSDDPWIGHASQD